jgi:hypothetical protein
MTDRELLEMAANAAGYEVEICNNAGYERFLITSYGRQGGIYKTEWRPLEDDGDAFRLIIKLKLLDLWSSAPLKQPIAGWKTDAYAATRRAIVEAAAVIGSTTTESVNDR